MIPLVSVRNPAAAVKFEGISSTILLAAAPVLLIVISLKSVVAPVPLTVWFDDPLKVTSVVADAIRRSNIPLLIRFPPICKALPPFPAEITDAPLLTVIFPVTLKLRLVVLFPIVNEPEVPPPIIREPIFCAGDTFKITECPSKIVTVPVPVFCPG